MHSTKALTVSFCTKADFDMTDIVRDTHCHGVDRPAAHAADARRLLEALRRSRPLMAHPRGRSLTASIAAMRKRPNAVAGGTSPSLSPVHGSSMMRTGSSEYRSPVVGFVRPRMRRIASFLARALTLRRRSHHRSMHESSAFRPSVPGKQQVSVLDGLDEGGLEFPVVTRRRPVPPAGPTSINAESRHSRIGGHAAAAGSRVHCPSARDSHGLAFGRVALLQQGKGFRWSAGSRS